MIINLTELGNLPREEQEKIIKKSAERMANSPFMIQDRSDYYADKLAKIHETHVFGWKKIL